MGEEFKHMSVTFPAFKRQGVFLVRNSKQMSVTFPGFNKGPLLREKGTPPTIPEKWTPPHPEKGGEKMRVSEIWTWNGDIRMAWMDPD